jgi:hypothetical protein
VLVCMICHVSVQAMYLIRSQKLCQGPGPLPCKLRGTVLIANFTPGITRPACSTHYKGHVPCPAIFCHVNRREIDIQVQLNCGAKGNFKQARLDCLGLICNSLKAQRGNKQNAAKQADDLSSGWGRRRLRPHYLHLYHSQKRVNLDIQVSHPSYVQCETSFSLTSAQLLCS